MKRGISPMSREPQVARPAIRRTIQWPTIESVHRTCIEGEGAVAIKEVVFSTDGSQFLVNCECCSTTTYCSSILAIWLGDDKTVRIWNNQTRTEIAQLAYNSPVISAQWMTDDDGIISLCEDGLVSKWSCTVSLNSVDRR